ncbi:kinase-like protein [Piromyces finnis]|uniref:Kinase-like protein n=1 Tax=Piromyces finnis TaxID=1754191 RepID=A0A1Y1VJF8_9FUNG|nr:kinase-like protein [Piromyces finnis]|eukprot:ORX57843.1 kinase-like protein [Piromyces finnis]
MSCKYYSYFSSRTPFQDVQNIFNKINFEKSLQKSYQEKTKYQNVFSKQNKINNQNDFVSMNEVHDKERSFVQYQDEKQLKKLNAFHIQQQQEIYLEYLFANEKKIAMKNQNLDNINEWLLTKFNNNYSEAYCKMFPNVYQNQSQENKIFETKMDLSRDEYQYPNLNEKLKRCNSYQYLFNHKLNSKFLRKYELQDELGSGGFGFVLLTKERTTNKKFAVKFIFKSKIPKSGWVYDEKEGSIPMECFIMKKVNHPNIVKYIDSYSDEKLFYIVMELHGNTWAIDEDNIYNNNGQVEYQNAMDLFECIESRAMRFTEFQAKYIFKQIFAAVNYLYKNGIVHRDLKDENILIDKHFNIKLTDFGAASYLKNYNENNAYFVNKFLGTMAYAPPEILKGEQFGTIAQEVFSLGTILYLLIFGEIPFKSPEETIFSNNIYLNAPRNVRCSKEVLNLMEWMLQKRPEDRPSMASIINHPWMRNNSV